MGDQRPMNDPETRPRAQGRLATVAITAMTFHLPVYIGDVLCVYVDIVRVGRTSIATWIEAWALRRRVGERVRVTEGEFVYVALDAQGRPRPVPREPERVAEGGA